jgi:hypothetical protein
MGSARIDVDGRWLRQRHERPCLHVSCTPNSLRRADVSSGDPNVLAEQFEHVQLQLGSAAL